MQRDTPMRIWGRSMTKRWTYSVRNTRRIPMKNLLETQKFKTMVEDVYTAWFISFVKPNC
ncbi:BnaA01g36330D [Brassica napus]|uniref:BnaA01g36330D protein n=1 Tax=Brassica napus TaxID=3708 RepID=A0A078IUZ3_BRANA|nr:BnaA01g36330D [Brassica napus]